MLITQFCYSRNKPNFYLINYLLIMPKMNPAVGQISVEEHMHSSHSKLVQTNELEHDLFHALRAPTFMRGVDYYLVWKYTGSGHYSSASQYNAQFIWSTSTTLRCSIWGCLGSVKGKIVQICKKLATSHFSFSIPCMLA